MMDVGHFLIFFGTGPAPVASFILATDKFSGGCYREGTACSTLLGLYFFRISYMKNCLKAETLFFNFSELKT